MSIFEGVFSAAGQNNYFNYKITGGMNICAKCHYTIVADNSAVVQLTEHLIPRAMPLSLT